MNPLAQTHNHHPPLVLRRLPAEPGEEYTIEGGRTDNRGRPVLEIIATEEDYLPWFNLLPRRSRGDLLRIVLDSLDGLKPPVWLINDSDSLVWSVRKRDLDDVVAAITEVFTTLDSAR